MWDNPPGADGTDVSKDKKEKGGITLRATGHTVNGRADTNIKKTKKMAAQHSLIAGVNFPSNSTTEMHPDCLQQPQ